MEVKLTRTDAKCDNGNVPQRYIFGWEAKEDGFTVYFDIDVEAPKWFDEKTGYGLRIQEIPHQRLRLYAQEQRIAVGVDHYLQIKLDSLKADKTVQSIKVI